MAKKSSNILAMDSRENDWRAESDLNTLLECERIEKDPKRLAAAQKLAKQRLMDLAGVASEGASD
jgi:hypothetical protein